MKRWIQAFVLLASPLLAFDLDCCGDFEIGAEALYWKAQTCQWQYGSSASTGFNSLSITNVRSVKNNYDWGFRIFGSYDPRDCSFLSLDWTYLRTYDSASEARATVFNQTLDNNILAKTRARYNRVNLRGGYQFYSGCKLNFYAYAGARWVDIELKRKITGNSGTAARFAEEKSELSGGALEFGFGGLYRFDCGLNLVGNLGPVAVIGKRKHSFKSENFPSIRETNTYPGQTVCLPGLDFRIGLNTTYECSCFTLTAEIGYEINYYFSALTTLTTYLSTNNNARLSICRDIGFGGPYASLGLRF